MSGVKREPAITRRHPAADLPERSPAYSVSAVSQPESRGAEGEKLSEQHNVRIRPSTKERLTRLVDRLRYESGDRSISIASLTDQAIIDYLDKHNG